MKAKKKTTKKLSIQEMGGKATLAKYGPEHYRKISNKRWRAVRAAKKLAK